MERVTGIGDRVEEYEYGRFGWARIPRESVRAVGAPALIWLRQAREEPMTTEKELDSLRQAYMDAFNAGDADAVAALHTTGSVSMPAGLASVTGRDAIRALMESSLTMMPPGVLFEFQPVELRVAEGWAVERGITRPAASFPAGKYVMLYEKDGDGRWRIAWTITNSDAAPPAR